jgi:putative tricarboxylic transport membrane protein
MTVRALGAAVFLIAVAFVTVGSSYRIEYGDPLGPAVFPLLVGFPALFLSGALIVFPKDSHKWGTHAALMKLLAGVACLLIYAFTMETVGFLLATFAMFAVLAWLFGANSRNALVAGSVAAPGLYVLFDIVLGLPLPAFGEMIG